MYTWVRINKSFAPFIKARNGAYLKDPDLQQCSSVLNTDLLGIVFNNVKFSSGYKGGGVAAGAL